MQKHLADLLLFRFPARRPRPPSHLLPHCPCPIFKHRKRAPPNAHLGSSVHACRKLDTRYCNVLGCLQCASSAGASPANGPTANSSWSSSHHTPRIGISAFCSPQNGHSMLTSVGWEKTR